MYDSPAEYAARRATRKDWTVTTSIDPSTTHMVVTVESPAGWGNAGVRNLDYHFDAIKARVRRVFAKAYPGVPVSLVLDSTRSYGTGVMYAITFHAKARTSSVKGIGDRDATGILEITDTRWDVPTGIMYVTIRETVGHNCLIGGYPVAKARALAKRTIPSTDRIRESHLVRTFKDGPCDAATFAVFTA